MGSSFHSWLFLPGQAAAELFLLETRQPPLAPAALGTGVYVGIQQMEYGSVAGPHLLTMGPYFATGGPLSVAAGRLSFIFGFTGLHVLILEGLSSMHWSIYFPFLGPGERQKQLRTVCWLTPAGLSVCLSAWLPLQALL
jgi:hypothetical protein